MTITWGENQNIQLTVASRIQLWLEAMTYIHNNNLKQSDGS